MPRLFTLPTSFMAVSCIGNDTRLLLMIKQKKTDRHLVNCFMTTLAYWENRDTAVQNAYILSRIDSSISTRQK